MSLTNTVLARPRAIPRGRNYQAGNLGNRVAPLYGALYMYIYTAYDF